ncbi:MAG: hypothetical protein JJ934_11310 [Pseudomonadales bacterium]|nr:hypothetical protein [Pseudomonadales bacterium]MBO6594962.1 hypothetical protein [Pseudomonadales bacterium]MBO6657477.1 hypothetical protein [Pseudomonadales bacterium]MBO6821479.1 hypothetical protein [Pseudomonadales bacterium]
MTKTITFLALLTMSLHTVADEYVCTSEGIVRSISVEYEHKGWKVPCKVRYDKPAEGGTSEYPWSAKATPGYCEDRAAFLAGKLENWGWQCERFETSEDDE